MKYQEDILERRSADEIPIELLAWFEKLPYARKLRAGEGIYQEGESATQFYYLQNGSVKVFVTSESGAEKTITIYKEKHIFGEAAFFDGLPRMSSAKALTDTTVIPVNRERILQCFQEEPKLAFAMIQSISKLVRMLSGQINSMSFLSAEQRIAGFMQEESGKNNGIVPFTQEEIGSLVGVSRVTVARICGQLKKQGLIDTHYGTLRILDSEKFIQYRNGCQGMDVKSETQQQKLKGRGNIQAMSGMKDIRSD